MNLEQQSRNQTVQGVFPADDADETDGAKTFKRGVCKDRRADGGFASLISAGSAISALKTSWLLFPEIHPRPSALSAENYCSSGDQRSGSADEISNVISLNGQRGSSTALRRP